MLENLLRTKLYVPPLRSHHVARPHLVAQLDAGHTARLTLVSAPAGYGKSTILGDWVRQSKTPVAWLSLDSGDNVPTRFWSYFAAALQTIPELREAGVGEVLLNALTARQFPPIEDLLTTLVNDIVVLHGPYALILDDFHVITDEQIHRGLLFLLDYMPPTAHGLRLLLASRSDPPWPLARLRARGELLELRASDLRFEHDDVQRFLNQAMALDLATDDISTLEARTEGWITGLQMAALSLTRRRQTQGSPGVAQFIATFSGSHRFVLDYLVEEVLSQQPDDIQAYLLKTSILERLTAPLCAAVLGNADGQAALHRLESDNLFLMPLDEERRWYRYHHLFAELMRQKLRQTYPEIVSTLHDRASRWFEANGLLNEAVQHALATASPERAAYLVERHGMALLTGSELVTLKAWLDGLPEATVRQRPWLSVFSAWVRYYAGPRAETVHFLSTAEQALLTTAQATSPDGVPAVPGAIGVAATQHIRGHIAALRAYLALQEGDFERTARQARQALNDLPSGDYARATSAIALAESQRGRGDLTAWAAAYRRALAIGRESENLPMAVSAATYLADQLVKQGRLREAEDGYRDALRLATGSTGELLPAGGLPLVKLGDLLREWNDLAQARQFLLRGIHLCQKWGHTDSLVVGYVAQARTALAAGDVHEAMDAFQKAADLVWQTAIDPWTACLVDNLRLRLWLAETDIASAWRWAAEAGLQVSDTFDFLRDLEHVNLLRVLVVRGRHAADLALLEEGRTLAGRLLARAEPVGWVGKAIEILNLDALACQALGKPAKARSALCRALQLARTGGYIRLFADEDPALADLLTLVDADNPGDPYVSGLLQACREPPTRTATAATRTVPGSAVTPPVEPLSERELEVLRLLSSSLTVPEIAGELTIAVSTARTHIRNIYAKLSVHSRLAAIQRSRDLGLN